ncbi:MAG: peptidylprolyl isomerase [Pseudomonadota bacterium]
MPKRLTFLASAALVVALSAPMSAETAPDADTVVATVNGEEITLGHMIVARASLPAQYQQLSDEVLYTAIMDQLVQQSLLKQAHGSVVPKHIELQLQNENRSLLAAEMIENVMAAVTTDEAIQSAYDAKYGDGFGEDEYSAAHILVDTEEEAKAIRAELEAGADFAETAKAKSTGPSGPSGGDLGWFGTGRMVPEFEAAVVALEKGQVSDPVQTQFGWHLIVLNDTRKAEAPELDQVRQQLASEIQQQAVEAKVDELSLAAQVERIEVEGLDPAMLRDLNLIGR